jgi:glutaredoxin 1
MKAIVYGSKKCVWCDRVARVLEECEVEVEKFDVSESNNMEKMREVAGQEARTVPQVVVDGKYIGGYTEIERFLRREKLLYAEEGHPLGI